MAVGVEYFDIYLIEYIFVNLYVGLRRSRKPNNSVSHRGNIYNIVLTIHSGGCSKENSDLVSTLPQWVGGGGLASNNI